MKKIFTFILFAGALSFNAASAQNRNDPYNDNNRYQVNHQKDNGNHYGWNKSKGRGYNKDKGRDYDYRRQVEYDRMNREYDNRIDGFRKDRTLNRYERNRRIQQAEQERQEKAKAFGTGVVLGGIAAILLGVLISGTQ
jgi:hypothetical protein